MESRMKVECRPTKTRTQSNITHPDKQRTKTRFSSMEPFKMVCSIRILIEVFCSSVCISGDPFPLSVGHHKEVGKHRYIEYYVLQFPSFPQHPPSLPPSLTHPLLVYSFYRLPQPATLSFSPTEQPVPDLRVNHGPWGQIVVRIRFGVDLLSSNYYANVGALSK